MLAGAVRKEAKAEEAMKDVADQIYGAMDECDPAPRERSQNSAEKQWFMIASPACAMPTLTSSKFLIVLRSHNLWVGPMSLRHSATYRVSSYYTCMTRLARARNHP